MCARNRLLTYAPHSGLSNQMISLLNALALAQNLSRALVCCRHCCATLIYPRVSALIAS